MTLAMWFEAFVVFLALIKRGGGTLGQAKHADTAERLGLELCESSHRYISRYTCTLWLLQVHGEPL